jgi:hypothetical protein
VGVEPPRYCVVVVERIARYQAPGGTPVSPLLPPLTEVYIGPGRLDRAVALGLVQVDPPNFPIEMKGATHRIGTMLGVPVWRVRTADVFLLCHADGTVTIVTDGVRS